MVRTTSILVVLLLAGCGGSAPQPGDRLRVLFTGETQGRLAACICDGQMAGGFEFRQGFLARQSRPYLLVDTGNVAAGREGLELLRAEEALRRMAGMGYDACNVGEAELVLGAAAVARLGGLGVPLVSANVSGPGILPFVVNRSGSRTVAITGLCAGDRYQIGPGLALRPPEEALAGLLPILRAQAPVLMVLADLDLAEARALADRFPEVTAILFRGRADSHPPEIANRSVIASIYGGRYIGDATLAWVSAQRTTATGSAVLLDRTWAAATPLAPGIPAGIRIDPPTLAFGTFRRGQIHRATLTVSNALAAPVTIGRVYSPCTCFAMTVAQTSVPAGGAATIEVVLHSLELAGQNTFPLYVELTGAAQGLLTVNATATVVETGTNP